MPELIKLLCSLDNMFSWIIVLLCVINGILINADPIPAQVENVATFPETARGKSPSRIVSGWETEEGQIPFQLSIRMVSNVGGVSSCGASIIHPDWGLTAAHCTAQRVTFVVRAGAVNLTRPEILFETSEYYNHPDYNNNLPSVVQPNDVALLKFGRTLVYSDRVNQVRIQPSYDMNRNYEGDRLVASGWGRTWTNSDSPENMNWVYLSGVTNFDCLLAFGFSSIIVDSTICAKGYNVTSQSTCQGDSGGPLTIEEHGAVTIVGISSFVSAQGCHADIPAGFARPGHFHDWYYEVTGINFDSDPTPTERPTTVDYPTDQPTTDQERPTTVDYPTDSPTTPGPERPTTVDYPTDQPTTDQERPTTVDYPTDSPTTPGPERPTTVDYPTDQPTTDQERPTTVDYPPDSPTTTGQEGPITVGYPTDSPTTTGQEGPITVGYPTDSPTTTGQEGPITVGYPTDSPTTTGQEGPITVGYPTDSPTTTDQEGPITVGYPTDSPTTTGQEGPITVGYPTDSPTTTGQEGPITVGYPTDSPTTPDQEILSTVGYPTEGVEQTNAPEVPSTVGIPTTPGTTSGPVDTQQGFIGFAHKFWFW